MRDDGMSDEIKRLRAYAKRTAAEFQRAKIPLEGPLVTTYRTVVRRKGFLGMRTVSSDEPGPEVPELIGWLLWSHVNQRAELWESTGNPRRPRGTRLLNTWTITRGWWLLPGGSIEIVDHRDELIRSVVPWRKHLRISDRRLSTDEELVHPDLPWRRWGLDDKRFTLYEQGESPILGTQARKPGLRLSTSLTNLRKSKGTYVQRRPVTG